MNIALKIPESDISVSRDRPGWIPPHITHKWDTNPYAYQTEEELMPAGGLHGKLLNYVTELLRAFLESHGLMLLSDTFMLYRDSRGIKRRISPDLLLMPFRDPPPSAYDLDTENPPLCVVEITSPKSHLSDLKDKVLFYTGLGIGTYLVIDAVTPKAKPRKQTELHIWRKTHGSLVKIPPDAEGYLLLPEMNVKIKAEGHRLIFADVESGEILKDSGDLNQNIRQLNHNVRQLNQDVRQLNQENILLKTDVRQLNQENILLKTDVRQLNQENILLKTEASEERRRAEKLAEKLRAMGIDPDQVLK